MNQFLLVLVVALTVGAVVFGVIALLSGDAEGLSQAEPDGRSVPLPTRRPLVEADVSAARFDTTWRGYRMTQVDAALRRVAYDIGYKEELVKVLQAEVDALREGRFPDAEVLRRAREAAVAQVEPRPVDRPAPAGEATEVVDEQPADVVDEPATGEPAGEPASEGAEELAEEPAGELAEELAEEPAGEPADAPAETAGGLPTGQR